MIGPFFRTIRTAQIVNNVGSVKSLMGHEALEETSLLEPLFILHPFLAICLKPTIPRGPCRKQAETHRSD